MAVSKQPLSTGGLYTCSALIASDPDKILMGHIDASGNADEIASFIHTHFDTKNPDFKLTLVNDHPDSTYAANIAKKTAEILNVKLSAYPEGEFIDSMGSVNVTPSGTIQISTAADILQGQQQKHSFIKEGIRYVFATNATKESVQVVKDGINVNVPALTPTIPGSTSHFKGAVLGESTAPDNNLVGLYVPRP